MLAPGVELRAANELAPGPGSGAARGLVRGSSASRCRRQVFKALARRMGQFRRLQDCLPL